MSTELDLSQIKEGLVLRPGDTLLVSLKDDLATLGEVDKFAKGLRERLPEINVTVVAGVKQLAKIETEAAP